MAPSTPEGSMTDPKDGQHERDEKDQAPPVDDGDLSLGEHVSRYKGSTPVVKRRYDTRGPHR